ncbi:MAG TPA: hypothetical protein VHB48_11285 [Chitinophagaceae bacterium]|nr:hypothetical protein [Chitinophagaceae bacterium]
MLCLTTGGAFIARGNPASTYFTDAGIILSIFKSVADEWVLSADITR